MKRIILIIAFAILASGARAQVLDFSLNTGRIEAGVNLGQGGSFTEYAHFGSGASLMAYGFYLDYLKAQPQHRYSDEVSDVKWNDSVAFCINAGYQLPILSWLRLMPLLGYAQTNEGLTNGSKLRVESDESTTTFYHPYTVTPGTRIHYFNYGCGLSIQPCKWFSINAIATRYAIYGGIGFNLTAFAAR